MVFISHASKILPSPIVPCLHRRSGFVFTSHYSSLSAIHRGIRRSSRHSTRPPPIAPSNQRRERDRYLKPSHNVYSPSRETGRLTPKDFRRAIADGKIAAADDGSGRQSRRKRFHNPSSDFGKRSLVYHLKYGNLEEKAKGLFPSTNTTPAPEEGSQPGRPWKRRDDADDSISSIPPRSRGPSTDGFEDSNSRFPPRARRSTRSDDIDTGAPSFSRRNRRPTRDEFEDNSPSSTPRTRRPFPRDDQYGDSRPQSLPRGRGTTSPNSGDNLDSDPSGWPSRTRGRGRDAHPISIRYTTAASQFLYGKSVVKAALKANKRKFYHLYIYGGENRSSLVDDAVIMPLARKLRVPVTVVQDGGQPLMDKMSAGRPHNGYVLEASPIPQPPVASLGILSNEPHKSEFRVTLGQQTKEEEAINGMADTVRYQSPRNRHPLVLLLHEIVDPGNLGALIRTARYLGVSAIGITHRNSATLTPVVLKASAGAAEEIPIFHVMAPLEFLEESHKSGWKSYAGVAPDPSTRDARMHMSMYDIETNNPLADGPSILILGNEGQGLNRALRRATTVEVSIPRLFRDTGVDSLNVSVAGALLCHAFLRKPSAAKSVSRNAHQVKESQTNSAPKSDSDPGEPTTKAEEASLF